MEKSLAQKKKKRVSEKKEKKNFRLRLSKGSIRPSTPTTDKDGTDSSLEQEKDIHTYTRGWLVGFFMVSPYVWGLILWKGEG